MKILVIEDDSALTDILEEFLALEGYSRIVFPSAGDIISKITAYQPDLVLLDYHLPEENGAKICREIKEAGIHLPVILFSAFPKSQVGADHAHCDLFVEKPFDLDELSAKIHHLIAQYAQ
ncbi:response regulator transcription factor [Pedobacter sp. AW1-32]|uniref:response regulator transcription factor n=1 Tax=Pedobacter sp. AW1-32 TaxID=3383026 RepID=UPI003FF0F9D9